jgi:hypothetical protein
MRDLPERQTHAPRKRRRTRCASDGTEVRTSTPKQLRLEDLPDTLTLHQTGMVAGRGRTCSHEDLHRLKNAAGSSIPHVHWRGPHHPSDFLPRSDVVVYKTALQRWIDGQKVD